MDEKNAFDSELDPEIIKVRDKIINKIGEKPLDEVNSIIKKLLNESMDEVTRLGALAARLKIIRSKIDLLYERKVEIKPQKIKDKPEAKEENVQKKEKVEEKWIRIKMLEAGDVNGKQIDKGVILDVKEEDSKKLIDTKKAEIVEEEIEGASPIQKSEKDKNNEVKKEDEKSNDQENVQKSNIKQDTQQEKKEISGDISQKPESPDEASKPKNLLEKHEDAVSDDDEKGSSEAKQETVPSSSGNEKKDLDEKTTNEADKNSSNKPESVDSLADKELKEEGNPGDTSDQLENKKTSELQDASAKKEEMSKEGGKE